MGAPIKFDQEGVDIVAPPSRFFSISPHATDPLPQVVRAIYVGGTGDLVVRGLDDTADVTFKAVPVGVTIVGQFTHVRNTTTATLLVGQA